ncbi:hypothetical protein [Sphingomonas sp. G-3-2-10]|uniref:hypothetical protein n=1 Tax=Sphingomonas sp. G-3-2-10 TaxID=2728838 RepID=UPI00146BD347|nr:hypothetical protein [Sphingomonas sp. G-3-2-10]NML04196.1 hypothetical protein [Sphingomonas sp. G-3-2-10]
MRAMGRIAWGLIALLAAAVPLAGAGAQDAEPRDRRSFSCPIGGKAFVQDVGYFALPIARFPDGSWLGDHLIDVQIPVCPDNGLVLLPDYRASETRMAYRSYTPAELARLPVLIADPAYAALKPDGHYAQAYWLATQLGLPAQDRFHMLQRATWGARAAPLRRRLVERMVADLPGLIDDAGVTPAEQRTMRWYLINGLRELGRFDAALALLGKAGADAGPEADGPEAMRRAIAERDDARFPAELLEPRMVGQVCDGGLDRIYGPRAPASVAACKTRREREAAEFDASEAAIEESIALRRDPAGLAARCAATAERARSRGLAMACEAQQDARDEAAADELVTDGPALAAACDATPETGRKGPLFHACISYGISLESELAEAIARDDDAWAVLCPGGEDVEVEDRNSHVSAACGSAGRLRHDHAVEALLADPVALDAQCRTTPEDARSFLLGSACQGRETQKQVARIDLLATDAAAFARECGRYRGRIAASKQMSGDDKEEEVCRWAHNLRENRKVIADAQAQGLICSPETLYTPFRPRCVTKADHDAEQAREMAIPEVRRLRDDRFAEDSSLSKAARARAAAIVARAKEDRSYPKRRPGDRW